MDGLLDARRRQKHDWEYQHQNNLVPACDPRQLEWQPTDIDGDIVLHFLDSNPENLPNVHALGFHKAACLIWRMAGGAEPEELPADEDDDDIGASPRAPITQEEPEDSLERVKTWRREVAGSSETLYEPGQAA